MVDGWCRRRRRLALMPVAGLHDKSPSFPTRLLTILYHDSHLSLVADRVRRTSHKEEEDEPEKGLFAAASTTYKLQPHFVRNDHIIFSSHEIKDTSFLPTTLSIAMSFFMMIPCSLAARGTRWGGGGGPEWMIRGNGKLGFTVLEMTRNGERTHPCPPLWTIKSIIIIIIMIMLETSTIDFEFQSCRLTYFLRLLRAKWYFRLPSHANCDQLKPANIKRTISTARPATVNCNRHTD